jgi:hypothetical protein
MDDNYILLNQYWGGFYWSNYFPALGEVVPLLKINMDGQMQNLDGGMRG